jgi:hypothetical protein
MNAYNNNAKDVREANEICKMLGKKIKFKQCVVQQIVDQTGRAMTFYGNKRDSADLLRQTSIVSGISDEDT